MDLGNIAEKLLWFVPFLMALCFHEAAHAWMASRHGDNTAKSLGRLTLNPVPHIDVLGTIIFPLINIFSGWSFMFGWAKPVPINPRMFKDIRKGLFWTSFAGPLSNIILANISGLLWGIAARFLPQDMFLFKPLIIMLEVSVFINYSLAFFNLIPLPPLDGSKIVESFLSYNMAIKYEEFSRYSFWILLALMWTGALKILGYPVMILGNLTLQIFSRIFGAI